MYEDYDPCGLIAHRGRCCTRHSLLPCSCREFRLWTPAQPVVHMQYRALEESPGAARLSRREGLRLLAGAAVILAQQVSSRAVAAQGPVVRSFNVDIVQRRVARPVRTLRVIEGERVVIHWTCDEAVEMHLHGYDIELQLLPGTPGSMDFVATATGRFPINGHGFEHRALVYLEVLPR